MQRTDKEALSKKKGGKEQPKCIIQGPSQSQNYNKYIIYKIGFYNILKQTYMFSIKRNHIRYVTLILSLFAQLEC